MKMNEKLISSAIEYVRELFDGNSDGHGFDHAMRVYRNSVTISDGEECDATVVALVALLHDADDPKLFDTRDNANARAFLDDAGVGPETAESVIRAINSVSFSKNRGKTPDTAEGRIVQDADRLDAIGAVGIARTFAYGGAHGRSLDESVKHFHEKLLLLKDMMNTETGRRLAAVRHSFLEAFLRELEEETGEKR